MRKRIWLPMLLAAASLLCACQLRTVDQMYQVPKRPQSYNDLQSVMDAAMVGMEYSAPRSGENQQTVQMADLDGDGVREYLVFARTGDEKPLRILIFSQNSGKYKLMDTIVCTGADFDLVEYVQMDGISGMELVVGCKISEQLPRSACIYRLHDGQISQLLSTNYTKFLTSDLDSDGRTEVMILQPGETEADYGIAALYGIEDGMIERTNEVKMSCSAGKLKRVITGKLHGGTPAVFVASSVDEKTIITDVYALIDGLFSNISLSNESGTSVQTLRNYYVYADDIDEDGEVELPSLITMKPLAQGNSGERNDLIRWYAMDVEGREIDKMHTYHNFVGGWYLQLDPEWADRISVSQHGNEFAFYLWDEDYRNEEKIFSVFTFTEQNREEQVVQDNRFTLYKGESIIYAARLEVASGALRITQNDLIKCFHLIRQDWKTGEM